MYWQLTDEDGLPSMTVYDILQDDLGYIWLATANGICRYDGRTVTTFNNPLLKDKEIIDIEKDAWNRIWMVNLSGQIAYVSEEKIVILEEEKSLYEKELMKLHIEGNSLWILCKSTHHNRTGKSLFTYQLTKDSPPKLYTEIDSKLPSIYMIEGKDDNIITIGRLKNQLSISQYDTSFELQQQTKFTLPLDKRGWNPPIADFCPYQDRTIISMFHRDGTLALFDIQDTTIRLWYTFDEPIKVTGLKMTGDDFWLMSTEGIWTTTMDSSSYDTPNLKKVLGNISANNIILDREGSYWIVTSGQGVKIIPSLALQRVKVIRDNVPINEVYSLQTDSARQRVFSGHHEGILAIHSKNQAPQLMDLDRKGEVRDIYQSPKHHFYCITNNGSVVLDTLLQIKERHYHSGSKKLIIDKNEQHWLGTSSGVYYFSEIKNYRIRHSQIILLKRTYAIHADLNGRVWLGSINGLYYYQDSILTPFDLQGLQQHYITDFAETADSTLWVSTQANGIFALKNDQIVQRYTTRDGLSSNACKNLFWDGQLLWIGTNQGLNYLQPNTRKIAYLNKKDGLPSNEINDVVVLGDQVWAGTSKGLVYFPKNMIHYNATPPSIYLSSFKVWDKKHSLSIPNQLSSKQNNLAFEFIGLALKAKNAVTYKYKMMGVDPDWVYTSTPIARYPVVNPGAYHFEVYAINEDGVESKIPATLDFVIAKPWWQKWWVLFLAAIGLYGTIIFFINRHLKKAEQKRLAQNKIDQLRQKALQTQMNPHFIFNALSAIQKSMTTNEQEKALLYLSRFAKLIRSIFEYSKREEITLEEEIDFLQLYLNLEKLRFKNKIVVDFSVDPNLEQHLYSTLLPPLLLQPLVENAFKHGLFHKEGEGRLQLNFSKKETYLCFSIEDNGVGRDWAKQLKEKSDIYQAHQPSGISNIEERLNIINSRHGKPDFPMLHIEDIQQGGKPAGTRIQVYIYCENFELKP